MSDSIISAGDFRLELLELYGTNGSSLDITYLLQSIEFYEDIFSTSISGSIKIKDTRNLLETYPIIGQEKLKVKLRTPQEDQIDNKENEIDFSEIYLSIYRIEQVENANDSTKFVKLGFTSNESLLNSSIRISQGFSGKVSNIVEKILVSKNLVGTNKDITIEPTKNIHKFVIPNMRPFDAITMLARRATNTKGHTSYLFYETLKGYKFVSVDKLYDKKDIMIYNEAIGGSFETTDTANELFSIRKYKIMETKNMVAGMRLGLYASNITMTDIYTKSYKNYKLNYFDEYENHNHLDENPIISDVQDPFIKNGIHETPNSSFHVMSSTNGKLFSSGNSYPYQDNNIEKWLLKRKSKLLEMDNSIKLHVEIFGNTKIQAGDVIRLNIRNTSTINDEPYDPFYSGRYLITKLKHVFDDGESRKHSCFLEVVKDSSSRELPGSPKINIKTNERGTIREI